MIKIAENKEVVDLRGIIELMEKCTHKFHTLTYEREKFIKMVKCYIWHLQDMDKQFDYSRGKK